MLHIYAGNGKGKTTAAFGLALRFSYYKKNVLIIQFLKDGSSGEYKLLENLNSPFIEVRCFDKKRPFFWLLNDQQKQELKLDENTAFEYAQSKAKSGTQMIILDEILDSVNNNLIKKDALCDFIKKYKDRTEIILTGRNPHADIINLSDYYTEMNMKKHPYSKDINAREGIEY